MRIKLLLATLLTTAAYAAEVAPPADQIASAILAAPKDRRVAAMVLGYNDKGEVVTLRAGTNDMVCLADNPATKGVSVACYHKDLEPFMARGRQLAAEGKGTAGRDQRLKEVDEGKLKMAREPRMLYVLTGTAYDNAKGEMIDAYLRWVVYVPYATTESTGLPAAAPSPGAPWLMSPGTAGAHIMISPPKEKK